MPEVSFYLLPTESTQERHLFACKLIEKAYRSGAFAYVLTDSLEQSQQLDDLLWTFRAGSFVPHQSYQNTIPEQSNTVLIGTSEPPKQWQNTLINLSSQLPKNFQNAEKVLEILDNSEICKENGRQRYRQYQQAGIEVVTHKL